MCTVSFLPKNKSDFLLTSNRDEAPGRATRAPQIYVEEGIQLLFPKDEVAGGTWIGTSDKKRAISLMNGGFVPHERKPYYGRSRGLILKDLLMVPNVKKYLEDYDFSEIEPFTVVFVSWQDQLELWEIVWDGKTLHRLQKEWKPHIWSSSPLYSKEYKNLREGWFAEFLTKRTDSEDVLEFHNSAGNGNKEYGLIMDRGFVRTKSITQIVKVGAELSMYYHDLQSGETSITALNV